MDPLDGVWYSKVGSKLELQVSGATLSGWFSSVDEPGKRAPIVGVVDPDASANDRALSFAVAWVAVDPSSKYRSVSSYTGQVHFGSPDVMETILLLVDQTSVEKQYTSTMVAYDNFHR